MKATRSLRRLVLVLALVVTLLPLISPARPVAAQAPTIIFVNDDATGLNIGTSWLHAYRDLETALTAAGSPTSANPVEIWVAAGTYTPTRLMQDGYARSATFTLKSNVALYGGFAGNEASRENRDWQANETILSGDIGSPEDTLDNTYHVVSALSDTDSTTILDGFYVRYGYSAWTGENYPYFPNVNPDCGGGLYVNAGSPTVRNVIFRSNIGVAGAGMYVASGSPTLTNVTFQANRAVLEQNRNKGDGGGGLYLDSGTGTVLLTDVSFLGNEGRGLDILGGGMLVRGGNVTLNNAVFLGNYAYYGGGMYIRGGIVTLNNATFHGNRTAWNGAAMANYGGSVALTNSIVWGNLSGMNTWQIYGSHTVTYSSLEDVCSPTLEDCTGVISSDPMFVGPVNPYSAPTPYGDLHLNRTDRIIGTPVWDTGSNAAVTVSTDRDGNPRIVNGAVDMGAYETQDTIDPTGTISINAGAPITNHPYVTLTLSATDDQTAPAQMQMMVSDYQFFSGAVWEPFAASVSSWPLKADDNATQTVYVKYKDLAGHESATYSDSILLDTTAPEVTISEVAGSGGTDTTPPFALVTKTNPTITWSANDAGAYALKRGTSCAAGTVLSGSNVSGSYGGSGSITSTISLSSLPEGPNTVWVCVTDEATNVGAASATVTRDTTVPVVSIARVTGSGGTDTTSPFVTVTSSDPTIVWSASEAGAYALKRGADCTSGAALSGSNVSGTYSGGDVTSTVDLAALFEGDNTVWVCLTDGAPHTGASSASITKDTVAPTLTLTTPADGSTTNHIPSFGGSATTAAGDQATVTVKVYEGSSVTGTPLRTFTATVAGGAYAVPATRFAPGTYTAQAERVDSAGSIGYSSANTFTVRITGGITYVDENATGLNTGGSWADALTDLQAALMGADPAAGQTAEIWVAAGTYTPTADTDRDVTFGLQDHVAIYGGFAGTEATRGARNWSSHETILSGDLDASGGANGADSQHVVTAPAETTGVAVLDGFTIRHGYAAGNGGGLLVRGSPTLANLQVTGNSAGSGGGMAVDGGDPALSSVTYTGNSATTNGGGLAVLSGAPTLNNVTFAGNSAASGGGMYVAAGSPALSNPTFADNTATADGGGLYLLDSGAALSNATFAGNTAAGNGGGMYTGSGDPTLSIVTLSGNEAANGGGLYVQGGTPGLTLTRVSFRDNEAIAGSGGGVFNAAGSPTLVNVAFSQNTATAGGGGLHTADGSPALTNVTFGGNTAAMGGGLNAAGGNATLTNGIVWGNSATTWSQIAGTVTVTYSDVQGGYAGAGNVDADPLFVEGSLTLSAGSPAIDQGNSAAPGLAGVAVDLAGNPRFRDDPGIENGAGGDVDMGAYEFQGVTPVIADRLYVNRSAGGANTGLSWEDAFTELRSALAVATPSGDEPVEIWVAAGTYTPSDSDRNAFFPLKNGVHVYGGFAGTETSRSERNPDPATNGTILSGDLSGNDGANWANRGDNSFRVVIAPAGTTTTAALDGLTIEGGFGSSGGAGLLVSGSPTLTNLIISDNASTVDNGGGLYLQSGDPGLSNVTFEGNSSAYCGGGMYVTGGTPTLSGVTFSSNSTLNGPTMGYAGGGLCVEGISAPAGAALSHVTFSGNTSANYGGGMYVFYGDVALSDVTFSANAARSGGGGGMYAVYSVVSLTDVVFTDNTTVDGGRGAGMSLELTSDTTLTNVTFSGNTTSGGTTADGGGLYMDAEGGSQRLTNVVFYGNSAAGNGGGMAVNSASPELTNVTFGSNTASSGGGMYAGPYASATLTNSIVWGNSAASAPQVSLYTSSISPHTNASLTVSHNDIQGGCAAIANADCSGGNLDADPLFVSDADLRVSAGSPAIDAGSNAAVPVDVTTDRDGNPRIVHGAVDMGAYEFQAPTVAVASASGGATSANPILFTATFSKPVTGLSTEDVTLGGTAGATTAIVSGEGAVYSVAVSGMTASGTVIVGIPAGVAQDESDNWNTASPSSAVVEWTIPVVTSGTIHVNGDAPGPTFDGTSWANAYSELHTALEAASPSGTDGVEIWVAEGTYRPHARVPEESDNPRTATFLLKSNVAIYGGFSGNETALGERDWTTHVTVLSGDIDGNDVVDAEGVTTTFNGSNVYHVVMGVNVDSATRLDGVTVTGGSADVDFSGPDAGGGVYNHTASATFANVTIAGNRTIRHGGGMYNYNGSNPTLTNVIISRNDAGGGQGGGMYNTYSSSPILNGVVISGNTAYSGAGIRNTEYSSPTLTNVLISGNTAAFQVSAGEVGGMYNDKNSSPVLTNVTISGNSANWCGAMLNSQGSNPQIRNSIIWGNTTVTGPAMANTGTSMPVIGYSLVEGGCSAITGTVCGEGNIDVDPQFGVGSMALAAGSPAVNLGDSSVVSADFDLAGGARIAGGAVDMGAYEVQGDSAPGVALHPTDLTVDEGETASFGALAGGNPTPAVQWQVSTDGGSTWNDVPDATATTYSFTATAEDNGKQYRAAFGNTAGTAYSTAATLTVIYTDTTPPAVTISSVVGSGGTDSTGPVFSVFTKDDPTVTWSADEGGDYALTVGTSCSDGSQAAGTNVGPDTYTADSAVTSTIDLSGLAEGASTVWVCVTDAAANTGSAGAVITRDSTAPTGSILINGGAAYTSSTEVSLTLLFDDTGSGVALMQLSSDGTVYGDWEPYAAGKAWTLASGDGSKSVYVRYSDLAGNISDAYSALIELDATAPSSSLTFPADGGTYNATNWADGCMTAGLCGTAADSAGGSGVRQVEWSIERLGDNLYWDGTAFSDATEVYLLASTADDWANWHYAFSLPELAQYTVHVRATDIAGNVQSPPTTATFTVEAPTITLLPESLPDGQEEVAYAEMITAGGGTSPYTFAVTGGALPNGLNLTVAGVLRGTPTRADTFGFTVTATDAHGYAGSRPYSVTVAEALAAPVVTTHPENQTLNAGEGATFTAEATGNPTPTVQWQQRTGSAADWASLSDGDSVSGATTTTLTLTGVTLDMDGYAYRAVFTNSQAPDGVASNAATLTVTPALEAPAVTTQPQDQTTVEGETATFTAAASGNPAPTVQWQVLGSAVGAAWTDISGADSTMLTLSSVTVEMDGNQYRAVFSNSQGNATSDAATLTVRPNYTVTFDAQGGNPTPAAETVTSGDLVTEPAAPTRTGYTFGGWFTDNITYTTQWNFATDVVGSDITLYAQWIALTYTVSFDSQGGSSVAPQTVAYNDLVIEPADPTRTGYTFGGWYTSTGYTTQWDFVTDTVTADITLHAQWTALVYTVAFDAQGGSSVASQSVEYNGLVSEPAAPIRTGYTFGGWYTSTDYTAQWEFATDVVRSDITLCAQWTALTYTVSFDSQGGTSVDSQTVSYGELAAEPTAPTRDGYTFGGWSKDAEGTEAWDFASDSVTADITLYAQWTAVEVYTVIFDANGGAGTMAPQSASEPVALTLNSFTRTGYSFGGWNTVADGSGTPYADGAVYAFEADVTLYAQWVALTYTVSFDSQGGSSVAPQTVAYNDLVTEPADPTRTGYTFGGWYTSTGYTTQWDLATDTVTADITLYAKWTALMHTVTFDAQGGNPTPATETVTSGDLVTEPAAPSKDGYSFGGWFTDNITYTTQWNFVTDTVTTDITLYAKWTASTVCYSLTVTAKPAEGGTVETNPAPNCASESEYAAGTVVSLTATAGSGYAFSGWSGDASGTANPTTVTMAADRAVSATFEALPVCYGLTLRHTGSGSDPVASPTQSTGCAVGRYVAGEVIGLAASPDDGWQVDGWTGTSNDASTATSNSVTMPAGALTVSVAYSEIPSVVAPTITSVSPASVAVEAYGTTITLTGTGLVAGSRVRWYEASTYYTGLLEPTLASDALEFAAPAGRLDVPKTVELTVVNPDGSTSNIQPILVTSAGSSVTQTDTAASVDGTAQASIEGISATGTGGDGTLYVAQSDGRPVGDEPAFSAAGSFVDVYTSADSAFSSILVQICSDRLKPNSRLYWWNGAAWATVSPAAEYSAGPPECLTFTATSDSEPSVDQLTGTVFVAGTKTSQTITFDDAPPSAEYGSTFRVNPMATSGLPVSLGGTEGVCSVAAVADGAGFDVTMLAETGVCDLTTSQAGNDRYEAAPDVTRHVAAEQAAPKYRLSISLIMADYYCEK